MDNCSRSVETINIGGIQDDYTTEHVARLNTRFPTTPTEDADNHHEYINMTLNIRKRRDDIASFNQTLNYVFVLNCSLHKAGK
eukprot:427765-Amphidinium_carterae.1